MSGEGKARPSQQQAPGGEGRARLSQRAEETPNPSADGQPNDTLQASQNNDAQQSGQASANGQAPANGETPEGRQTQNGAGSNPNSPVSRPSTLSAGGANAGGGAADWGGAWLRNFDRLLNDETAWRGGPITGGNYGTWADRLRDIEEVLDFPDLRSQVATARERARLMRQDFKRDQKKPDWAVVRLQVMKPLLEVRARIADELARRESNDALVPIDRDPVPTRYSDLVRRYYEELGKDKASPPQPSLQ